MKQQLRSLETSNRIWGISPEAVFVFLSDVQRNTNDLESIMKLETLGTNISKCESDYRSALLWLSTYLGLLRDNKLSPLGKVALVSENPLLFIQTCLMARDYRVRAFLTDVANRQAKRLDLAEFESYFPEEGTSYSKLLASFHFLNFEGKSTILDLALVEKVAKVEKFPRIVENWLCGKAFFEALVGTDDGALVSTLTFELFGELDVQFKEEKQDLSIIEAIKHVGNKVEDILDLITSEEEPIATVLEKVKKTYSDENRDIMLHLLKSKVAERRVVKISEKKLSSLAGRFDIEVEKLVFVVNQLLFLQGIMSQVYLPYVRSIFGTESKSLSSLLSEIFGENIRVDTYFIRFLGKFAMADSLKGSCEEYLKFVFEAYSKNEQRFRRLDYVEDYLFGNGGLLGDAVESNVNVVKSSLLRSALSKRFLPFYFVYTLPDPTNLGKEITDKYMGKSEEIHREVYKLQNEWRSVRSDNSFSYTDMADKLFSKGLEVELQTKELRIMTPYTDYELAKNVSMLRRLIAKGYTLYILCRLHSDSKRWKIFRDGLLKGLGEKSKSVKVRTYTRFKEFLPASELAKLEAEQRKEFGVHAKLFIIGDASDGALLLGSANLLENSFNWNPECGVYTEDPTFIESAKAFFDFVWDLSEHDALDLSRLDRIPKGPFFPHYYFR